MRRSLAVKVPKEEGERTRTLLLKLGLIDSELKIKSDEKYLYIPISKSSPDLQVEIIEMEFDKARKRKQIEDIIGFSPGFEVIGDIAITEYESEEIAKAIMEVHKGIKTVLYPLTPVSGEYRLREYKILAGEPRTKTIYREYGCIFEVDIARVYFSPRLSTERHRVVEQVEKWETAVDMFAGAGTFAIQIAKKARMVYAVDKNPEAIKFLERNIALNKLNNVEVILGDIREVAPKLRGTADRIIMNLPHSAHEFLGEAMQIAKEKCIVHYYAISHVDDLFQSAREHIEKAASASKRRMEILNERIVRPYAPYKYTICIDFKVF
ncbi:MAG: class I SAM-dependent methyltransferase family protein [Methanocellales archaeon]